MQNNKNNKKPQKPTPANQGLSHVPANATHVLFANNGKKDPATGTTIPSKSAVESASNAVKKNQK